MRNERGEIPSAKQRGRNRVRPSRICETEAIFVPQNRNAPRRMRVGTPGRTSRVVSLSLARARARPIRIFVVISVFNTTYAVIFRRYYRLHR